MKHNKQRNEYLLDYLRRTYDSFIREEVRAEIGNNEYMKNIDFIHEKCAEVTDFMLGTSEHHIDEVLGEFYERKVV